MSELQSFIEATDRLVAFEAKFRPENHTPGSLSRFAAKLQELWEDVETAYQGFQEFSRTVDTETEADARASVFDKHLTVFGVFATLQGKIEELTENLNKASSSRTVAPAAIPAKAAQTVTPPPLASDDFVSSPHASNAQQVMFPRMFESTGLSAPDLYTHSMPVPPCDIPTFTGGFEAWPSFRDIFSAVFIRNSRLSDVERLFHLLHRTSGEANQIIKSFPLTNEGFHLAWSALAASFENKRMLVHNQLKHLFSLPVLNVETSQGLKNLQQGIQSVLDILKSLHVPVDNWDPIVVFHCCQKLPESTISLWEQSLAIKTELPTWDELYKFLSFRILTLVSISETRAASSPKGTVFSTPKSARTNLSHKSSPVDSRNAKKCPLCPNDSHGIRGCKKFKAMNTPARWECVKNHKLCFNCLSPSHSLNDCASTFSCSVCKERHHSWLHNYSRKLASSASAGPSTSASASIGGNLQHKTQTDSSISHPPQSFHQREDTVSNFGSKKTVLLGTANVIIHHLNETFPARALLDPGSEVSFISSNLRQRLRLPTSPTSISLLGVNSQVTASASKLCQLTLGSSLNHNHQLQLTAFVLPRISGNLPSFSIESLADRPLSSLPLADKHFYQSSAVDLLLGADVYPDIVRSGIQHDFLGSLVAQETIFGWVLTGPVSSRQPNVSYAAVNLVSTVSTDTDNQLRKFWETEEIPRSKILSVEDKFCENLFHTTTIRNADGKYVVRLPFKPEYQIDQALGDSRSSAMVIFRRNESALLRKVEFKPVYDNVIKEYLDLGHMHPVSAPILGDNEVFYLPHHPVLKPESTTTKVRVVFNASHSSSNGRSLNDVLYPGPALQTDLTILLLQWRLYRFVFSSDITKMYRQILVSPDQTRFQRILFRESPQQPVQDFQLDTVTFGVNCAPVLAIRTLLQLARDVEHTFPLASVLLQRNMYVDDVLAGFDDLSKALNARNQFISALSSAGFELRKWTANHKDLLSDLPSSHLLCEDFLNFEEQSSSKALGVRWNASRDDFYFTTESIEWKDAFTKREVLSIVARIFDPAGWLAPVVISAKILMQQVWQDGTEWDENLQPHSLAKWKLFVDEYPTLENIRIPRWVGTTEISQCQLHGFCDASEKAYAGVLYVRCEVNGHPVISLLTAKTRVAPLKTVSLPRLELCGALLLSQLVDNFRSQIVSPQFSLYCWTDSTIVLAWIQKPPYVWKTFVASRVSKIQEISKTASWRHVSGSENPADVSSRGITPSELQYHPLWWNGPSWLSKPAAEWPNADPTFDTTEEAKPIKAHIASSRASIDEILSRFSSLARSLRVLSYCRRFVHKALKRSISSSIELDALEIKSTKLWLILLSQQEHFPAEYEVLSKQQPLSSKSPLLCLNPVLDSDRILRINGRLAKASGLSFAERCPILLPHRAHFSRLLVKFIHEISLHGGNRLMLRLIRLEFWMPRAQNLIKQHINHCKVCILFKQKQQTQLMSALPSDRCSLTRPFSVTGVDFAGPFDIKNYTGRGCKITKGYVCVFVCFASKAIHLELANNLSTECFLAALARFVSRRGCPRKILSDNGTNFVGASSTLKREFQKVVRASADLSQRQYAHQSLQWDFIPAGAPHMGGLWEAGVKSFKAHFKKVAANFKYTFEEMSTLLCRIEACLNSRPLCVNSDNTADEPSITPAHLLGGFALMSPAEEVITDQAVSIVNRWRRLKALSHSFALRWKEEYLKELHKRNKWRHPTKNIEIGDVVVIRHENLPPTEWRLGRVEFVHPGTDQRVRVATIHTLKGKVTRPITKLVLLPKDEH